MNRFEIKLTDFENNFEAGPVEFLILNAQFDEINTINGDREVLKVDIKLTNQSDKTKTIVLKNHLIFIDLNQRSLFHQFVISVKEVLNEKPMIAKNLIGLSGVVELKYYQKDGADVSYERFNNWQFKFSVNETEETLKEHFTSCVGPASFDVTDDDIDF